MLGDLLPTATAGMIDAALEVLSEAGVTAAGDDRDLVARLWAAMVSASPPPAERDLPTLLRDVRERRAARGGDPAAYACEQLPALGTTRRNPDFWSDLEVRRLVIDLHRQVTVEQARAAIAERCGQVRTPSKSALARAWQRLDLLAKRKGR